MSVGFEVPETSNPAVAEVQEQELSRLQQVWDRCRQVIGRTALAFAVAAGGITAGASLEMADPHPAAAYAETGDYPDANAPCVANNNGQTQGAGKWCPGYQWGYYIRDSQGNITGNYQNSPRRYGYRNCTDWVAFRIAQLTGISIPGDLHDAKLWDGNAPNTWDIDQTPEPGDIAQSKDGLYGHVGAVEVVDKTADGKIVKIIVSQYNLHEDGNYSRDDYFPDADGVFWRDTAHTKKWDNFIDPNGTGIGINGEVLSNPTPLNANNTVLKVIKKNDNGSNLVFWAKAGSVFETSWLSGTNPQLAELARIDQQNIVDIDAQVNPDGERLVYTAAGEHIYETWYYPGQGVHTGPLALHVGNVKHIQKAVGPNGEQQLYVMTDQGVDEYWWVPNGDGVHKSTIFTLANPVAMKKMTMPDGRQVLYVADQGYVYENWWRPGDGPHVGI